MFLICLYTISLFSFFYLAFHSIHPYVHDVFSILINHITFLYSYKVIFSVSSVIFMLFYWLFIHFFVSFLYSRSFFRIIAFMFFTTCFIVLYLPLNIPITNVFELLIHSPINFMYLFVSWYIISDLSSWFVFTWSLYSIHPYVCVFLCFLFCWLLLPFYNSINLVFCLFHDGVLSRFSFNICCVLLCSPITLPNMVLINYANHGFFF